MQGRTAVLRVGCAEDTTDGPVVAWNLIDDDPYGAAVLARRATGLQEHLG